MQFLLGKSSALVDIPSMFTVDGALVCHSFTYLEDFPIVAGIEIMYLIRFTSLSLGGEPQYLFMLKSAEYSSHGKIHVIDVIAFSI